MRCVGAGAAAPSSRLAAHSSSQRARVGRAGGRRLPRVSVHGASLERPAARRGLLAGPLLGVAGSGLKLTLALPRQAPVWLRVRRVHLYAGLSKRRERGDTTGWAHGPGGKAEPTTVLRQELDSPSRRRQGTEQTRSRPPRRPRQRRGRPQARRAPRAGSQALRRHHGNGSCCLEGAALACDLAFRARAPRARRPSAHSRSIARAHRPSLGNRENMMTRGVHHSSCLSLFSS